MARVRRKRNNWGWVIFGAVAVVLVVLAVLLNINATDESIDKIKDTIQIDNSDLNINWDRYQTVDVELKEDLNISESGTYHLTGSLYDGQVVIDAGVGEVRLILDNVTIKNSTGPAILCYNAENLVIELTGENILADGEKYSADYDEDVNGVIYSKADLAFRGEGALSIEANYADGVVGKDDVIVRGGNYNLETKDDGIRGKDSVYVTEGDFVLKAAGNAIASSNETDFGKGFVLIEDGKFTINAGAKGIKAINNTLIYGGDLKIESYDDAIHSNNNVGIANGNISINSGDDGIHADTELIINNGTIDVTKSYEGLESQKMTINNGTVNINATDDGINAGGGADNSAKNRPGANPFNVDEDCIVTINGGEIYINAAGDGIDSNGYLIFNGGSTVVDGPTNNGNGALDAGAGITIQGGEVFAVGASGMAESLGANSNICNLSIFFTTLQDAGTKVEIKNSAGETIAEHTANKTFSHLAFGSEKMTLGETYKIYLNDKEYATFTVLEVTTTIGSAKANPNNMPPKK